MSFFTRLFQSRQKNMKIKKPTMRQRYLLAILLPALLATLTVGIVTHISHHYGAAVFIGLPVVMTVLCLVPLSWGRTMQATEALTAWMYMMGVSFLGILIFGFEGILCLMMAFGLCLFVAIPIGIIFFLLRHLLAKRLGNRNGGGGGLLALLVMALPLTMAMEAAREETFAIESITSSIIINAPREIVWHHVVTFSDIDSPPSWYFRRGVAYPIRAHIDGTGVGAIRYCEFSTGSFVEPITIWDEPRHLAFDVIESPPAMTEWNPFHQIAPPHIDDYFTSHRGEFHLEDFGEGRTLLTGTTWYTHRIAPAWYWRLWTNYIVQDIHGRVLEHVAHLAEGDVVD